ncbi:winged helix-turn-helix domain-containing protein [Ornithinibacillus halotolerans]|uniref:Uncharacterized protein n=1 Tax=Ornithinibacillus halotolerans TaxID=1274357 RepID=A0A916WEZ3_9BACI|nr:winged helix-turn-helix domain-containing protein [Ornithinibacillus halotolerans]GGA91514.1 hypothetical protein GCM10008025_37540 [Ornithinibacillus halotolerans]
MFKEKSMEEILKIIDKTGNNLNSNQFKEAEIKLYLISKIINDNLNKNSFKNLEEIYKEIELLKVDKESLDKKSYLQGKIYTITETLSHSLKEHKTNQKILSVKNSKWHRDFLYTIKEKRYVTNSELCKIYNLKKNNTSNILNNLKNKLLINSVKIGRNIYYSITSEGLVICDKLKLTEPNYSFSYDYNDDESNFNDTYVDLVRDNQVLYSSEESLRESNNYNSVVIDSIQLVAETEKYYEITKESAL